VFLTAGQLAWYIIKKTLNHNPLLSWEYIREMSGRNAELYNERIYGRLEGYKEIQDIIQYRNNQGVLMPFLVSLIYNIMQNDPGAVRDDMMVIIMMDVKTVVDCLVLNEDEELAEICDSEYSLTAFRAMERSVMGYIEEFMKSPSFTELTDYEKRESVNIITEFSEIMYNDFLMHPLHWNARRAFDCMAKMSCNTDCEPEYASSIEPVLKPFFIFCKEKDYVPQGGRIARRLNSLV
jgi:hypothetical protein